MKLDIVAVVAGVAYALVVVGTAFASGGGMLGMLPFVLALKRVHVVARNDHVELRGLDPAAMFWAGIGFALVTTALLVGCSWWIGVPAAVASGVLCFGFRLSVRVRARRTRMVRTFAFAIPWCVRRYDALPDVFVDGWGDFSDPESLYVQCGDDRLELAWNYRDSGVDLEALARRFNEVVHEQTVRG